MSLIAEAIALAAPSFTGQLLRPTDHAYDDRRRVHNGLIDYLEDDALNPAAVAYGPNLPRLRAIKTKYDPENFFRHNVNILPN